MVARNCFQYICYIPNNNFKKNRSAFMKTPTILIVERNDTLLKQLKQCLIRQGYHSVESSSKTEVLGIIQCSTIHLVIVGSLEGGRDSLQVAQDIREWNTTI